MENFVNENSIQSHVQSVDPYVPIRKKDYYDEVYHFLSDVNVLTLADVGGATGDFAWFAPETLQITTIDVSQELINLALQSRVKNNLSF